MAVAARQLSAPVGVHYTPDFVVDYMVRETLGLTLSPEWQPGDPLPTIVDPACGDGAFLRGAAEWLAQRCGAESVEARGQLACAALFGVDVDAAAIAAARQRLAAWVLGERSADLRLRTRWEMRLAANFVAGDALIGVDWPAAFPQAFAAGGFDCVLGNPPYRRELDFQAHLAAIAATPWGRPFRTPRMDLWYYFVHRGLEVLRPGGRLAYITSAYWMQGRGAAKLIAALRDTTDVEEVLSLDTLPVFAGVSGRHVAWRVRKKGDRGSGARDLGQEATEKQLAIVRQVRRKPDSARYAPAEEYFTGHAPLEAWTKTQAQLFRGAALDLTPADNGLLARLGRHPPLQAWGAVRQGIAENPATINRKTAERFGRAWAVGAGVFVLTAEEVEQLQLPPCERAVLRPYHVLADVGRYRLAEPSRWLIYATRQTWPELTMFPVLAGHLDRFRTALEARREARLGRIAWWHLHWPRADALWRTPKVVSVQLGVRPAFVAAGASVCVPFSTNVWTPAPDAPESLEYVSGVLNSRLMWDWFARHAKSRGAGLEVNGHVLAQAPVRRIDFANLADAAAHERITQLVRQRMLVANDPRAQARNATDLDEQIDAAVESLYGVHSRAGVLTAF